MSGFSSAGPVGTDTGSQVAAARPQRPETRFLRAAANIQEAMAYLRSGIPLNDNEACRLCGEMKRDAIWLQRMGRFLEHDHQIAAQGERS